jgi:methionine biosynthesis protein MetW
MKKVKKYRTGEKLIDMNIFQKFTYLIKKVYDKNFYDLVEGYEDYHDVYETGNTYRAKIIASWIKKGSSVIDIGCGGGFVSEYVKEKRDAKVTGVDVSNKAVEKAKKRGIDAYQMDLNHEIKLRKKYDYIIFGEILEHLPQPEKRLAEAFKYVKKGIIVTIPNSAWLPYRLQLLFGLFPRQSWTHLHFWSHKDFGYFCETLGIKILDFKIIQPKELLLRPIMNALPNLFSPQLCYLLSPRIKLKNVRKYYK